MIFYGACFAGIFGTLPAATSFSSSLVDVESLSIHVRLLRVPLSINLTFDASVPLINGGRAPITTPVMAVAEQQ